MKLLSLAAALILSGSFIYGQSTSPTDAGQAGKATIKVTTDIVSSYIWRGTVASLNPNIQPTFAVDAGGLEVGVWGSTDFLASYKEVDPYVTYTISTFKIGITDYDWTFRNPSYFDYKNATTDHIIEGSLSYLGTDKLPLSISLNTMVYGADKKWDKNTGTFSTKQNFSTYVEFGWAFKDLSVFLGVTPGNGYYGAGYGRIDGFAVCNLGVTSTRNIKITNDFSLPLKGTIYINPQAENIHFVIATTF